MKKTKKQLEQELEQQAILEKEREISNELYAIKLIEKIVLGALAAFGLGVIGILVKVIADYTSRLNN